jgi:hypothetical protein
MQFLSASIAAVSNVASTEGISVQDAAAARDLLRHLNELNPQLALGGNTGSNPLAVTTSGSRLSEVDEQGGTASAVRRLEGLLNSVSTAYDRDSNSAKGRRSSYPGAASSLAQTEHRGAAASRSSSPDDDRLYAQQSSQPNGFGRVYGTQGSAAATNADYRPTLGSIAAAGPSASSNGGGGGGMSQVAEADRALWDVERARLLTAMRVRERTSGAAAVSPLGAANSASAGAGFGRPAMPSLQWPASPAPSASAAALQRTLSGTQSILQQSQPLASPTGSYISVPGGGTAVSFRSDAVEIARLRKINFASQQVL